MAERKPGTVRGVKSKHFAPKALLRPASPAVGRETKVAQLTRELNEAIEQQTARDCPSADDLRLVRRFEKGGSGSSGLEFKRPAADAASGGLRWLHA